MVGCCCRWKVGTDQVSFQRGGQALKTPIIAIAKICANMVRVYRTLGLRGLLSLLVSRLYSVNHYYLLGKNLSEPQERPATAGKKSPLREITKDDIDLIENSLDTLDKEDRKEVLARLFFYWSGFRNCYVVQAGADIAYLQWIIFPSENHIIKEQYSTKFYPLADTQVVVENAFTFPRYRGLGYLTYGTTALLDLARSFGYRYAICYIRKDRIASLNDFTQMGFRIRRILCEYKFFGWVSRKL
jgi:hypothetical protein